MNHICKAVEPYYTDCKTGKKPFEIRIDDRDPRYEVGDTLTLQQFIDGNLTGEEVSYTITYALRDTAYVKPGFVVLGIKEKEGTEAEARRLNCSVAERQSDGKCRDCQHYFGGCDTTVALCSYWDGNVLDTDTCHHFHEKCHECRGECNHKSPDGGR